MISTIIQLDLPAVLLLLLAVAGGLWLRRWWRERAGQTAREPLAASLDVAQRKIRDFATSQGLFVSTLAEEIRAPLGTALIHAELLLASSREPATVERYANSLVEDVRHLTGLVESFLQLVHPMAQEDTSSHVPVHVHDVVLAAATRCKYLASTRDVTIVPTLAEPRDDAPLEVLGNTVLLEAMLENLLRNAVVSSPRGSRVALHVRQLGDEVRVAVHDMGPPIPDESLDEVFNGFFQGPEPLRPPLASGLSLAIAMRVAEHHRGTISLVNVPAGGCKFEVQLPRWRGDLAVASQTGKDAHMSRRERGMKGA